MRIYPPSIVVVVDCAWISNRGYENALSDISQDVLTKQGKLEVQDSHDRGTRMTGFPQPSRESDEVQRTCQIHRCPMALQ